MSDSGRQGVWAAPGRVNVIGEHTDYNNGYVLPIALPHVVRCVVDCCDGDLVRVRSQQHAGESVEVDLEALGDADITGWPRYPLGVVWEFRRRGTEIPGVSLSLDGDVPVGAGLSSSAAVECAVAVALRDLFDPDLGDDELIDITSTAENDYVGARTGTLDQSASLLCTADHALFLDVATGQRTQIPFDPAGVGLELLVIDTNTPHRLVDGHYANRRAQCAAAATALGVDSLRAITDPEMVAALDDPILRRRARHVVTENARVLEVVAILEAGADLRAIGAVLSAGHRSLRDDFAVSTPELDVAVDSACGAGAYGARMVGGGFGGSVIALTDTEYTGSIVAAVTRDFEAKGYRSLRTFVAVPSSGARRLE